MAVLVEKATSDLLIGPDWGMNLEICDSVNQNPSISRDVVKAIKKRLNNKNAKIQLLTLTVLEMVMKNCGDLVHQMVAKDVLHDMVKIVKKKADVGVRDKALSLLESWQKAFGGPTPKYLQYSAVYDDLRRSGVQFPVQTGADTAPMFTPPAATHTIDRVVETHTTLSAAHTTRSIPQLAYGLPAFPPARLDDVLAASENFVWSAKDLDGARRGLEVLNEMLNALDPGDKQAVHDDVITQLVEQCVTNQKITRQLVNSTSDENLLCQGLTLNDDIQQVLEKHSAIVSRSSRPAELTPGSPKGLVVYDQEDDEAEEELVRLAHRSSSKSSLSSACSQDNGLQSNAHYPPAQQRTTMVMAPSISGGEQPNSNGGFCFEGESLAASLGQVTQSRSPQVSDELSSMINPFANMASIPVSSSHHYISSATVNNSTLDDSKLASHQLPDDKTTTGQQNSSTWKVPLGDDDDMLNPTSSSSPWSPAATEKSTISSLPPPPIFYTERARFFEERRQMNQSPKTGSLTPSSTERRMRNLNLASEEGTQPSILGHPASSKFQSKQVLLPEQQESSIDRLFEDLVDIRSLRANFKNAGVASSFSRPNVRGAGGM